MKNEFDQTIGLELKNWKPPQAVQVASETQNLEGKYCKLVKLEAQHAPLLMKAFDKTEGSLWTFLPYGPFTVLSDYENWIASLNSNERQTAFAYLIQSKDDQALGLCSYLRMSPNAASIEIGNLSFSPQLQKTPAATEVIFLMIDAIFKLGYRRCEWKCNDLNSPSISAAKRYGFTYEGTFRQAMVVKSHNRDTAWFSIMDNEWEELRPCFVEWLADDNFDEYGQQIKRLSEATKKVND